MADRELHDLISIQCEELTDRWFESTEDTLDFFSDEVTEWKF